MFTQMSVLLWCHAYYEMSLYPILLIEIPELVICVLSSIICPEALDLSPSLVLHFRFSQLEFGKRLRLVRNEVHPNFSRKIINKCQEIHMSSPDAVLMGPQTSE
jgi:hypothetical protein